MVSKIKKILVPLDGSSNSFRGLDVAIHMARQCHATITGLYVAGIVKPRISEPVSSLEKILLEHAQKIMKKAKLKAAKKEFYFLIECLMEMRKKELLILLRRKILILL